MFLIVAAAALQSSRPPNTWEMGGGRSWMNPPKLGDDIARRREQLLLQDLRHGTKAEIEAELREAARIQAEARRGDVRAMRLTGFMLLNGVILTQDRSAGLGWFYEAAIRNDVPSMYVLGCAFKEGIGVEPDPKLADYWLSRAQEKGVTDRCP